MSVGTATIVTTLTAGHPFGSVNVVRNAGGEGPNPGATYPPGVGFPAVTPPAVIQAGFIDSAGDIVQQAGAGGLTGAGVAAVCAQFNTYYSGLSASAKAAIGYIKAVVTSSGLIMAVQAGDVAAQAAALVTILNNASNFGPIGT